MTREEWDAVYQRHFDELTKTHPHKDPGWRQRLAHTRTVSETRMSRPPGLLEEAAKVAFKAKVKGESMEWKWSKASWKGLRAALGSALAIAVVAFGEALLSSADTAEELLQLGAPALLVPVLLGVGAVLRNWLKQKKKARQAGLGVVTPPANK